MAGIDWASQDKYGRDGFSMNSATTLNGTPLTIFLTFNVSILCEILGSHVDEYKDGCLLGCCAV
jgi:hypothetical protein